MRNQLLLVLLIVIIFLSGCTTSTKENISSVGLSTVLTSDIKQAKTSMPVTFILTVKNLASEDAKDIFIELLNLTDWEVEDALKSLDELLSNDLYKFSWIAYAPSIPNKTFVPYAEILYSMETKANLTLRVYDNNYLNTLKQAEKDKIKGKSALLSSSISKNTPVTVTVSLQQPFILTSYSQKFPFVIEIKNIGLGQTYGDEPDYPPRESEKNYVKFSYATDSNIYCDHDDGDLIELSKGSKSIACKLTVTQDELNNYADFAVDFTISYVYLDRASLKIAVVD